MSGKLYIVPTPVGNLGDMTPRAIDVLKSVDLVLAEDTRTSGVLMQHFDIHTKMASHHKFNEHETAGKFAEELENGKNIALVTDAGTPGISDPGFMLVRECRQRKIEVETLPGATAFVPALVNSGLPCERFTFEGFLPQKKGRNSRLEELAGELRTMIFYESPLRLVKTLQQFCSAFGESREASVSREISKMYNHTQNGTLKELYDYFSENTPRGEIVIIVAGNFEKLKKDKIDKYAQFKNRHINSKNDNEI